jgi:hypothetical protein
MGQSLATKRAGRSELYSTCCSGKSKESDSDIGSDASRGSYWVTAMGQSSATKRAGRFVQKRKGSRTRAAEHLWSKKKANDSVY